MNFRRGHDNIIPEKEVMVDWQVTATTVYCDAVDDEVTILVYRDFSTRCTGFDKYNQPDKETPNRLRKQSKKVNRPLECKSQQCQRVTEYKEKLKAEEAAK